MTIKGSIQQEEVTILNLYAPKARAHGCLKQMLVGLKEDMDLSTLIAEDFDTSLSSMDRLTR